MCKTQSRFFLGVITPLEPQNFCMNLRPLGQIKASCTRYQIRLLPANPSHSRLANRRNQCGHPSTSKSPSPPRRLIG